MRCLTQFCIDHPKLRVVHGRSVSASAAPQTGHNLSPEIAGRGQTSNLALETTLGAQDGGNSSKLTMVAVNGRGVARNQIPHV